VDLRQRHHKWGEQSRQCSDWVECPAGSSTINRTMTRNDRVIAWFLRCEVDEKGESRVTELRFRVDSLRLMSSRT
jgi:hypothetical protein